MTGSEEKVQTDATGNGDMTDRAAHANRMHRRQILRRTIVTGGIVGLVGLLTYLSVPIVKQIRTILVLRASQFNVDWQLDADNWTSGGATVVNFNSRSWPVRPHDEELALIPSLLNVQSLNLSESNFMEESLAPLKELGQLRELNLTRLNQFRHGFTEQTGLSDGCLEAFRGLSGLESLSLSGNRITDAGLALVAQHSTLEYLDLDVTDVTDAGLVQLESLKGLKTVSLGGTKVTPDGTKRLQGAIPGIEINMELDPELERAVRKWRSAQQ
jgi:hypothetical protein